MRSSLADRALAPHRWRRRYIGWALAIALVAPVGLSPPHASAGPGQPPAGPSTEAVLAEAEKLEGEVEALAKQHRLEEALAKAKRVLASRRQVLGPEDPLVASAMSDLGAIYVLLEDMVQPAPLLRKAVAVLGRQKKGSKEHATAVSNWAAYHQARGLHDDAVRLSEQALQLYEQALGPAANDVAVAKRVLALRIANRDQRRADELLQSAIDIHDRAGDKRGSVLARLALGNLRRSRSARGVEKLFDEAVARAKRDLGSMDIITGRMWQALANANSMNAWGFTTAEHRKEILQLADDQFGEAEKVLVHVLGPRHTDVAELYSRWSMHAQAMEDLDRAAALRAKANDIEEEHLDAVLAGSSEKVKLAYLQKLQAHADDTIGLHVLTYLRSRPHHPSARLAFTAVLRRKGRALDSVADTLALLRRRLGAEDRQLVDELRNVRAKLAAAVIRGPGNTPAEAYKQRVNRLGSRARELESQLAAKSAGFKRVSPPVTIEAVQAALPKDTALVEIVQATPRDAKAYSNRGQRYRPRYVAYVLRAEGPMVFAHLAEVSTVDKVVGQFRRALSDPTKNVGDPGWRLYTMTMGRLHGLLAGVKHLYLSPDGALNLVPFGALRDDDGFLIEKHSFSYLSSGRDLLRFKSASEASGDSLVIANPAFDHGSGTAGPATGTRGTLSNARFPALPGTGEEAAAIGKLLPGAKQLTGTAATEKALKRVQGPALLHVATHGFFLTDARTARRDARGLELDTGGTPPPEEGKRRIWHITDPLLRSGIALSGANQRRGDAEDDGVLTGLEAASLDLHGTKLVVLSACETGIGDTRPGEGVFGLRRALVIAGSESQIMSLWKVDDEATRDLMTGYYEKLLAGAGRADALRQIQLEMLQSKDRRHPYFWAAFIASGDPAPLDLGAGASTAEATGGTVPSVDPAARGCACRVGAARDARASVQLWAVLALAMSTVGGRRLRRQR